MLKLYNSYSGQIEEFKPIEDNKVKMYVCGPTVYDLAHLGHARCYITWDVLYRYLKYIGYNVTYCRNVTDVDDKILNKAERENKTPDEIAEHFYNSYKKSMNDLNVSNPDIEPFATKNLGEMIAINKKLIENGYAYENDGDVYFRVKKFTNYGNLSKQPIDDLESGVRVDTSEKKEDSLDFALWKKDEKHGYPSPWGKGRPGWHIECSAMARKHLGKTIDIHAGGADLIFPHHENEIAQSECANGCKFSNFWLHNGFVTINHEKMSKSLGNFLTIDGLVQKYDSNTIRFFILTNHYRMPIEFCDDSLIAAQNGIKRLKNAVNDVLRFVGKENIELNLKISEIDEFQAAMNDDLNTSVALSILFELANKANKAKDSSDKENAAIYISTLIELSNVLGFKLDKIEMTDNDLQLLLNKIYEAADYIDEKIKVLPANEAMKEIIKIRNKARTEKNWDLADKIRKNLTAVGLQLKDTTEGTAWIIGN